MTVSEQIDQFIAENGGNTRDALNVALAKLHLAERRLEEEKQLSALYRQKGILEANRKIIDFLLKNEDSNLPDSQ